MSTKLSVRLPITINDQEQRHEISILIDVFKSQFPRQSYRREQLSRSISYVLEVEFDDLKPFTRKQLDYLAHREWTLSHIPDIHCAICEVTTEKLETPQNVNVAQK